MLQTQHLQLCQGPGLPVGAPPSADSPGSIGGEGVPSSPATSPLPAISVLLHSTLWGTLPADADAIISFVLINSHFQCSHLSVCAPSHSLLRDLSPPPQWVPLCTQMCCVLPPSDMAPLTLHTFPSVDGSFHSLYSLHPPTSAWLSSPLFLPNSLMTCFENKT